MTLHGLQELGICDQMDVRQWLLEHFRITQSNGDWELYRRQCRKPYHNSLKAPFPTFCQWNSPTIPMEGPKSTLLTPYPNWLCFDESQCPVLRTADIIQLTQHRLWELVTTLFCDIGSELYVTKLNPQFKQDDFETLNLKNDSLMMKLLNLNICKKQEKGKQIVDIATCTSVLTVQLTGGKCSRSGQLPPWSPGWQSHSPLYSYSDSLGEWLQDVVHDATPKVTDEGVSLWAINPNSLHCYERQAKAWPNGNPNDITQVLGQ